MIVRLWQCRESKHSLLGRRSELRIHTHFQYSVKPSVHCGAGNGVEQSVERTCGLGRGSALNASLTVQATGVRVCLCCTSQCEVHLSAFSPIGEEAEGVRHLSRSAEGNLLPSPPLLCCSLLCLITDVSFIQKLLIWRGCHFPAISSVLRSLNIMGGAGHLIMVSHGRQDRN